MKFRSGYPIESELYSSEFKLRLGIEIRDSKICVRDIYDFMCWRKNCPQNQCIELENGFYHITLYSNVSSSGVLGDNQIIYVYLHGLNSMPKLRYDGVPIFSK